MNTTYTAAQITALIAAGIDLNEFFAAGVETPASPATPVTPAKVDGRNHAARQHNYEARMARRAKTSLGGLTKAERSDLYAAHPELSKMSATKREAAWRKIVAEYKAAN